MEQYSDRSRADAAMAAQQSRGNYANQAQRPPQIMAGLADLESAIGRLQELTQMLYQRLGPIMHKTPPEPTNPKIVGEVRASETELGDRIRSSTVRIHEQATVIGMMTQSLEI